jgi:phospholipase/carboxylesterase
MTGRTTTRRAFTQSLFALAGAPVAAQTSVDAKPWRLTARPGAEPIGSPAPAGLHPMGLRGERDALLYIPEAAAKFERAPLVVSLHGATRKADRGIELFRPMADELGFLLLAPASKDTTWDAIIGEWGPDPAFINRCLAQTFRMRSVDAGRIAMAGFSDGASYSLSIGLANGGMFQAVFGFSPGFIAPAELSGKPPVFISHGTIDPVLDIDACSRRIVPALRREGYKVTYKEFEGKHTLPPEIASEAMKWFIEGAKA